MGNTYAPDGYRYGAMFTDGSVAHWWNGRTQRARVEEFIERNPYCLLVRRGESDETWVEVWPHEKLTNCLCPWTLRMTKKGDRSHHEATCPEAAP